MRVADVVVRHVPEVRHLAGILPDDELCARAFEQLEDSTRDDLSGSMYSESDHESDCKEAATSAREEIKEDIYHILDSAEWSSGDDLAKLIRAALDAA